MKSISAAQAPTRTKASSYPPKFAKRMEGRIKQPLGDLFSLTNFGVNRTTLQPGAQSALLHRHSLQDEFIYVLEGQLELHLDDSIITLSAGDCAGFPKNSTAHCLKNTSNQPAVYLEIGDRTPGDTVSYPQDDLAGHQDASGTWHFTHKDGTPW